MESSSSTSPFRPDIVKGKVALITGGGSSICFEIATQLELHGSAVAIMGHRKPVLNSVIATLVAKGIPGIREKRVTCIFELREDSPLKDVKYMMRHAMGELYT